jgi:hypothetical protein
MNKRDNPYTPGAGRKPRTLAGRDQDLESFQSLVERLDAGTYERSLGITPRVNWRTLANKNGRSATRRTLANGHEQTRMCHKRAMVTMVWACGYCRIREAGA